jgi:hypothetical protein
MEIDQLSKYIQKKRPQASVFNAVMNQSILPKFAYQMKFSALSMEEMEQSFTSIRELLLRINNIHQFPHAVIFGCGAEKFLMDFKHVSDYVNAAKHGIINRLLDGHIHFKYIIITLIHRAVIQKKSFPAFHDDPWCSCFTPEQTLNAIKESIEDNIPTMADIAEENKVTCTTWATSWINWLHEAHLTLSIYKPPLRNPTNVTQTPIEQYHNESQDLFELRDLQYILIDHNINYVEELFTY